MDLTTWSLLIPYFENSTVGVNHRKLVGLGRISILLVISGLGQKFSGSGRVTKSPKMDP